MQYNDLKYDELIAQNEELKSRLEEAQDVIQAIRNGEVDAVIVKKGSEPQLYTLKSADHTYRVFIEKMNDGAVTLNQAGIVLYCNSSFANMIGLELNGVLGSSFKELVHPKFRETVSELIRKAWTHDCKAEITLTGRSGTLPVLLSLNNMETDGGESISIVISDLSFQKEAQAQKKAIEQKDEFISIASHELKTPVTSIKGYIQLLRHDFQQEGNSRAESMLAKADLQVNKLSSLINELLDVKKIETGQLQFHEALFDLNELVEEITEESSRIINRHTIRCDLHGKCEIYGDRNKIAQVITNLLDNASKYSPPATDINVKVSVVSDKARCTVQDHGMGIPKDQQSKVFERFYRVSGESENTYAGLGLGLYISSEIIKRHKGCMGVESELGKGSTFYFELPLN
jgi:PAS domain S-box-containing protein